jgi:hypothetical protein
MEREIVPCDGNSWQRFMMLPLKPNGQIKIMRAHDRILSDPAIFRHDASSGVHRRSLPEHDTPVRSMGKGNRHIFILARDVTLGRLLYLVGPIAPCPSSKQIEHANHVAQIRTEPL